MFIKVCIPLFAFILAMTPAVCLAAENGVISLPWWEIGATIIGIPLTLILIRYYLVLTKKARLELESKERENLQLEQPVKQGESATFIDEQPQPSASVTEPLVEIRQFQFIILRFIILYVLVLLVGQLGTVVELFGILTIGNLTRPLVNLIRFILIISLGIPLFKDVNRILGLRLRDIFKWRKEKNNKSSNNANSSDLQNL